MSLSFLTPFGALLAVAAVAPLLVFALRERRAARVREALRVGAPGRLAVATTALALGAVVVLLAVAAMQPVLSMTRTRLERTDAELYVVLDISRSMLASTGPGEPTRYERARAAAERVVRSFGDVPIGLASITDRTLPHVLPTTDARVYLSALDRSIGIERPPPAFFYTTQSTTLGSLRVVATRSFFSPNARKRVLIVLTDGETREVGPQLGRAFRRTRRRIEVEFVRFWGATERIYDTGVAEAGYKPDADVAAGIDRAARATGGQVYDEQDVDGAIAAARAYLGKGPTRPREREGERVPLMPYVTALVALPLGLVLRRRNL